MLACDISLCSEGDVAVVFFGGHAIGRADEHYLFGINADRSEQPPTAGTSLSSLLASFAPKTTVLLFIDACRNT